MTLKIKQKKDLFFLKLCMNSECKAIIQSGVVTEAKTWVNN